MYYNDYIAYLYQEIDKYCDFKSINLKKYSTTNEYYIELITDYPEINTKRIIPFDREKYQESILNRGQNELHQGR